MEKTAGESVLEVQAEGKVVAPGAEQQDKVEVLVGRAAPLEYAWAVAHPLDVVQEVEAVAAACLAQGGKDLLVSGWEDSWM